MMKKEYMWMPIIEVYSKDNCSSCTRAKGLLDRMKLKYEVKQLDVDFTREQLFELAPTARTYPQIFIDGEPIGGYEALTSFVNENFVDY